MAISMSHKIHALFKKLMRCYSKTESVLCSKYIFSVIVMYIIDFNNLNTDPHVKCITNKASSHPHDPLYTKGPSTHKHRVT